MKRLIVVAIALLVLLASGFALARLEKNPERASVAPVASGFVRHAAERAYFVATPPNVPTIEKGQKGWGIVYEVLQSPRCLNCHPAGDTPYQTDQSRPHKLNITRKSEDNGMPCSTCHATKNSDELGVFGGPPGAPNWHLPHQEMPLIFEDRSAAQLCRQLKNPRENGRKTLSELTHHVSHDPLVLWGWNPGGNRTKPPHAHADFVAAFKDWQSAGGPCP